MEAFRRKGEDDCMKWPIEPKKEYNSVRQNT